MRLSMFSEQTDKRIERFELLGEDSSEKNFSDSRFCSESEGFWLESRREYPLLKSMKLEMKLEDKFKLLISD